MSNYNYLVINKAGEWHYFKYIKDIAKWSNTSTGLIYSTKHYCLKHYNKICPNRKLYIQCLYNDATRNFPTDTTFIWDTHKRCIYNKFKYDYYSKNH